MPDQQTAPSTPSAPDAPEPLRRASSRRVLFHRAGLAALAGGGAVALAACADSSPGEGTTTNSPNPAGATPESPSASASTPSASVSPSASASESASSQPSGTKVAKADVPVGGGKVTDKFVVTQPTSGEFKAFTNICTHQGCPVSAITNGEIICNCHGSHFSITDGAPVSGPAAQQGTGSLAAKTVTASGSDVFVAG